MSKKEEIEKAAEELKDSMIELESLNEQDTEIKAKRAKAQSRVSFAKDAIRNIRETHYGITGDGHKITMNEHFKVGRGETNYEPANPLE